MPDALENEIRGLYDDWISSPSASVCARLADRLRIAGRPDEALEVASRGLQDWPANNAILLAAARCHRDTGNIVSASEAFDKVLGTDPFNLVALRASAEIAMIRGRHEDAIRILGDYLFENPADTDAEKLLDEAKEAVRKGGGPDARATVQTPAEASAAEAAAAQEQPPSEPVAPPAPVEPPSGIPQDVSPGVPEALPGPEPGEEPGPEQQAVQQPEASAGQASGQEQEDKEDPGYPRTARMERIFQEQGKDPGAFPIPPTPGDAPASAAVEETTPPPAAGDAGMDATAAPEEPAPAVAATPQAFLTPDPSSVVSDSPSVEEPETPAAAGPERLQPVPVDAPAAKSAPRRDPRSLLDLFSLEERDELGLEPYRSEEA
jgi:tetratricopeptide (TPR) repeat protein